MSARRVGFQDGGAQTLAAQRGKQRLLPLVQRGGEGMVQQRLTEKNLPAGRAELARAGWTLSFRPNSTSISSGASCRARSFWMTACAAGRTRSSAVSKVCVARVGRSPRAAGGQAARGGFAHLHPQAAAIFEGKFDERGHGRLL